MIVLVQKGGLQTFVGAKISVLQRDISHITNGCIETTPTWHSPRSGTRWVTTQPQNEISVSIES